MHFSRLGEWLSRRREHWCADIDVSFKENWTTFARKDSHSQRKLLSWECTIIDVVTGLKVSTCIYTQNITRNTLTTQASGISKNQKTAKHEVAELLMGKLVCIVFSFIACPTACLFLFACAWPLDKTECTQQVAREAVDTSIMLARVMRAARNNGIRIHRHITIAYITLFCLFDLQSSLVHTGRARTRLRQF